jgi:hypothetical protein
MLLEFAAIAIVAAAMALLFAIALLIYLLALKLYAKLAARLLILPPRPALQRVVRSGPRRH